MKKYELTSNFVINEFGVKLFQIKATVDFGIVKKGELGGYIENEKNLAQNGNAWVDGDARVYGNAWVYGDARVYGNAWVFGDAWVSGNAWVYGDAEVFGDAEVSGNAWVYGDARVHGNAWVYGNARVYGDARVFGDAWVYGNARVSGDARVYGNAWVSGDAEVFGNADYATISGFGSEYRPTTFFRSRSGQIEVRCGCFYGTIEEFRAKVKQTHGKTKKAIEYLKVADLMEYHFSKEEEEKKVEE